MWGSNKINCISLFDEFGATVFLSLVKSRVKNENPLSTFVVDKVINNEIMSFTKILV